MGGGGTKAPAGYQPSWQGGADQNYQNLVQNATPWATTLPGATIPGAYQAANNIANNPYAGVAQTGANTVAGQGQGYADIMGGNAQTLGLMGNVNLGTIGDQWSQLGQLGSWAVQSGQGVNQAGKQGYAETQGLIPSTTQGANYAPSLLGNAAGLANLTSNTALGAIPGLTGGMDAAGRILNTGFDPQRALYDRTLQQTTDSQNAINSMYGLGSSAYGAGLAGDAVKNFNIDWQNNQLARETQALGAYGQEQGVVANNLTNLLGSASNNYANLTNAGVNQYTGLTSNAVNNLDSLVNTGMNARATGAAALQNGLQIASNNVNSGVANQTALQGATRANYDAQSQALTDTLQTRLSATQAPQLTYQNQQQAALAALASAAQAGGYALNPSAQLAGEDATYMGLGQSATQNAQHAAQINNAQANAQAAGIGKMISTVASIALAPATGGLSLFALGGGPGGAMGGG